MLANSDTWLYGSTKDGANAVWMFNQVGVTPGTLNIDIDISVNGTPLTTQHFEGTSPTSVTIDVTSYLNATGTNSFDFTAAGTGKVTYEVSLDYFVPRLATKTDPTLTLDKSITPVIAPGGQGTVTLDFTPSDDVGYVVINDYIPGGFTLDTSSIYQLPCVPPSCTDNVAYEVSGNRVTFALQSVGANDTVTISYSMTAPQATLGLINVRGAECLLMYQPTITGSSAGVTTNVGTDETEVTVSIDAPDEAAPGSDFTADINISEVVGFDACNYDVSFDASVLRLDDITSGLIDSTTIPVDMYNEVSPGTYRVVQNVSGLSGVSGSGYLAVLHFHVIGSGGDSSSISLSDGMLADNLAEEIEATWVGDSVDITSVVPGDANGDGNVNALDITKVERIISGLDAETPGADANQDGNVNALDITKIEIIIAGLG